MNLSEKIYTYRKGLGLSQEALAEELSVSRQAVSKWETGEATPELAKIPVMAKLFHVTADHLLSDEDPISPAESIPLAPSTPEAPASSFEPNRKNNWIVGVVIAGIGGAIMLMGILALVVLNIMTAKPNIFTDTIVEKTVISEQDVFSDGTTPIRANESKALDDFPPNEIPQEE